MKVLANNLIALLILVMGLTACSRSSNPAQQASDLEATLQKLASAQPEADRAILEQALASVRAKDYVSAMVRLQAAQMNQQLSGDLRGAAFEAKRAISAQLNDRALRGDQEAVAALQAYEKAISK